MTTIIFDASPLITACKFKVKKLVIDHLLPACQIVITPSVEREVAILGAPVFRRDCSWRANRQRGYPGSPSGSTEVGADVSRLCFGRW